MEYVTCGIVTDVCFFIDFVVFGGYQAAVIGFVGSPWTLATYIVEGMSSSTYKTIKTMIFTAPDVLDALLSALAEQIATYMCYQIQSGAQCMQLFDSWGGQLPPYVSSTHVFLSLAFTSSQSGEVVL
jgi:uroporphyrinogen-III decarboxylase